MSDPVYQPLPKSGDALRRAGILVDHPGAFFQRRVLEDRQMTVEQAASEMEIDLDVLRGFVKQKINVDEWLASKLAKFLGTSSAFWMNLQIAFDE